jgi:hypothetical protein
MTLELCPLFISRQYNKVSCNAPSLPVEELCKVVGRTPGTIDEPRQHSCSDLVAPDILTGLVLSLPLLAPDQVIQYHLCRSSAPSVFEPGSRGDDDDVPFADDPEEAIISFQYFIAESYALQPPFEQATLLVHRASLLTLLRLHSTAQLSGDPPSEESAMIESMLGKITLTDDNGGEEIFTKAHGSDDPIPWEVWGPSVSTWSFYTTQEPWVISTHGSRHVLLGPGVPQSYSGMLRPLRIYDFSVCRPQKTKNPATQAEGGDATTQRAIPAPCFADGKVNTELAYREICSNKRYPYAGALIDGERVVGVIVSHLTSHFS